MTSILRLLVLGLSCFALVAAGQNTSKHLDSGSQRMLTLPDAAFAIEAAQSGLAEVQLGKLAANQAGNPEVKVFGQQMIDDHTKANDRLKAVAQEENMTLPATMDAKGQAAYEKLRRLSGAEFEKAYVANMVKDHEEDVKEFQKEAAKGKDPKIKDFASQTEPMLQEHLDKIKSIRSKMAGKAGS